jgi:hypothetical protein
MVFSRVINRPYIIIGGGLMSKHYDNSPALALAAVYPEHTWNFEATDAPRYTYAAKLPKPSISPEHKTFGDGKRLPRQYWEDLDNRLEFLRWFAAKKGLDGPDHPGWYKVSHSDFAELGGMARRTFLLGRQTPAFY